jgi:hypothetical protein
MDDLESNGSETRFDQHDSLSFTDCETSRIFASILIPKFKLSYRWEFLRGRSLGIIEHKIHGTSFDQVLKLGWWWGIVLIRFANQLRSVTLSLIPPIYAIFAVIRSSINDWKSEQDNSGENDLPDHFHSRGAGEVTSGAPTKTGC